jgi:hypothetical protein
VGTAILTTTASPTAGYGMLAECRESGVLDDRATLVAVTMNTVFGFAQHIRTFYAPVLIPILGLRVEVTAVADPLVILVNTALKVVFIAIAVALLLAGRNCRVSGYRKTGVKAIDDPRWALTARACLQSVAGYRRLLRDFGVVADVAGVLVQLCRLVVQRHP